MEPLETFGRSRSAGGLDQFQIKPRELSIDKDDPLVQELLSGAVVGRIAV